jgi:hypothetical protein
MAMLARQPGFDRLERFAPNAHKAPLALGAPLDQTSALQHLQVT